MREVVFALLGWPRSWGLESSESSLTCLVVNGWLSTGASAGTMAERPTRGLFMWLSHSMVAGFQGQVSQENKAETVLHFMNCSWKSHNVSSTVVRSLPGFKKKEHKPHFLVKRCQCHFIGRAHKMVCIAIVIFGNDKLPQTWNGRSFRIGYLESMTVLSKDFSKDHIYQ